MTDPTAPGRSTGVEEPSPGGAPSAPRTGTACEMTVGEATGAAWTPLHCSAHGPQVAWINRSETDRTTAAANAWANHLRIVARAAAVDASSARRLAAPYASTCTYDTGAQFDCAPACTAPPTHRIEHGVACYGWYVQDVCGYHRGATLGRVYPDEVRVHQIPTGGRPASR